MAETKAEHVLRLASEVLEDIELSRLEAEALLLKVMRLARLAGDEETRKWLLYELSGYNSTDSVALAYMARTGRWISQKEQKGYWGPLAQQEATIKALNLRLQSFTTQGVGGANAAVAVGVIANKTGELMRELTRLSGIRSRVFALLHSFVAGVYYESIFSRTADSIFEQFRTRVDPILQRAASDLPERMSTSYDRLLERDREAVSAALNTCRRVIDAFADVIFASRDEPFELDGQLLQVGPLHHQNRLNVFIAQSTSSKSRRKRLRQTLANVYDRVCAGIHDDISVDEAQALVLSTYMLLGEIAILAESLQARTATPTV